VSVDSEISQFCGLNPDASVEGGALPPTADGDTSGVSVLMIIIIAVIILALITAVVAAFALRKKSTPGAPGTPGTRMRI
jgi:hypothetical protein